MSDPDRSSESYQYDANGNVIQTTDARGASGTIYAGYDGLNRQVWRNTSNSPTGAYVTFSYDSTTGGNYGVGRLTGETFSGALGSGSYSNTYDLRGQTTNSTLTVGGISYPVGTSYNDAGQALTLTYPTGETVAAGYSASGWLGSLTRTLSGNSTTLLDAISYTGNGGAAGQMTSAHLGNATYSYSASFDALARPTDLTTSRISDSATLFEEAPTYDAVGNIAGVTLTLPTGTDVQAFCYDEQNRLTWAGSAGTTPCTGTAITPGTLTSAQYTQSFSYDALNRLTDGPLGSYVYGDAAHLHAATSVGTGSGQYTASYDASGNMTCRAPDGSTTCSGTQTGQQLSWDNEGRLTSWQNAPSSPTSTDQYLYDGAGKRVEQQVITSGTTTTTIYVGDIEQVATTGGTTTTTTYYYAGGQRIALAVNGTLSYLASDLLGSATVALDGSGTPTASQLYAPYGSTRYSNGTMPTDYGFTGQRADAASGLDYYGARYYDPTLGQFTSADTVMDGLNRYSYVGGNPISYIDPSGHEVADPGLHELQGGMTESPTSGGGALPLPPPPDLGPLIKTIGMLIGMAVADVSTWISIPTAQAPGYTPADTGADAWNVRKVNAFRNTWHGPEM
jgi:RHS repeat-associated protein